MAQETLSKNSKEYKEAGWFINRLIDMDTLSHEEIVKICKAAAYLAEGLEVTRTETVHKLEQTW